jgi:hypothetical protein
MSKPKQLYYVEVIPGGKPLGYREPGGKTYATKPHAVTQRDRLIAAGHNAKLFVTVAEWQEVID